MSEKRETEGKSSCLASALLTLALALTSLALAFTLAFTLALTLTLALALAFALALALALALTLNGDSGRRGTARGDESDNGGTPSPTRTSAPVKIGIAALMFTWTPGFLKVPTAEDKVGVMVGTAEHSERAS